MGYADEFVPLAICSSGGHWIVLMAEGAGELAVAVTRGCNAHAMGRRETPRALCSDEADEMVT